MRILKIEMNGTLRLFLEFFLKKIMGGGYHDDSRNYFPKSQGLSAEPPATGGAAAPFLLFQVLLPKTKKKCFGFYCICSVGHRFDRWQTLMTPNRTLVESTNLWDQRTPSRTST